MTGTWGLGIVSIVLFQDDFQFLVRSVFFEIYNIFLERGSTRRTIDLQEFN